MPTVTSSVWINAPLERVYAIAKDNRSFPEFMKDLESLTVVEEDGSRVVSDYVGTISAFGMKVRWKQEDVWDDAQHLCTFRQIEGDYDQNRRGLRPDGRHLEVRRAQRRHPV